MATKKITQLDEATTLADADVVPIVSGGATKKSALTTLATKVGALLNLSGLLAAKANASSLAAKANDNAVVHLTGDETVAGTKTLSNSPLIPTAIAGDNTQKAANTAFVTAALAALIGGATPSTLDTLQEIATALGDDPNLAATLTTQIASKLTQAQADLLYRAIGWVPAWGDVTGKPDFATQADAEAGTNNAKFMTPLRVAQAITALATGGGGGSSTDLRDIWLFG